MSLIGSIMSIITIQSYNINKVTSFDTNYWQYINHLLKQGAVTESFFLTPNLELKEASNWIWKTNQQEIINKLKQPNVVLYYDNASSKFFRLENEELVETSVKLR